jgi:hypothetical protein
LPTTAPLPQTTIYPDPSTGVSQTGRLLDPSSKQYIYTSDGRIAGMPTVPQLVTLAFNTKKFRSALPNLGQTFGEVLEKGPNFQRAMATKAHDALSYLIGQKMVQLVAVNVLEPRPDAGYVEVVWRDLTMPSITDNGISMPFTEYRTVL